MDAQLTTSTGMTPNQLVQNVLLGPGVTASAITFTGDTNTCGIFNGVWSDIGLNSGVILSNGNISGAPGPNNAAAVSTMFGLAGDPDLDMIMNPTQSFDATILEFDFIPTSDSIKFNYVFASEEYMEYVDTTAASTTTINDGFGFFISGPGISGPFSNSAINIALIPGTSLPVTMSNLNYYINSAYYIDNGDGMGSGTAPDGGTVQYDGFTVPLVAAVQLQCGQTYHIKLAIADGGDNAVDSGVFLEAGSFASPGSIAMTPLTALGTGTGPGGPSDTLIYEGCGSVSVLFDRGIYNFANGDTIQVSYSGTALNGQDYSPAANFVYFAPGQQTASINITTLGDFLTEAPETVILTVFISTPCGSNDTTTLTLTIVDSPPMTVTASNDTLFNCPVPIALTAVASGGIGVGSFHYTWTGSSSTTDTAYVMPMTTTTYYVTAYDSCGNTATDSVTVTLFMYTPMQISLNADTTICKGASLLLDANVTNGRPDYSYVWSPAITILDTATVAPAIPTTYTVTVTDACGISTTQSVVIGIYDVDASFSYTFGTTSSQVAQFTNLSDGATDYVWNFGDSATDSASYAVNPLHSYITDGDYTITLIASNQLGCTDTASEQIHVDPDFYFYFPNAFTPNGNGGNDVYMGYGVGLKSYRMTIFNRWGEQLFTTTDLTKGWDGIYKGHMAEGGVYLCIFDLEGYHYEEKQYAISINLIR